MEMTQYVTGSFYEAAYLVLKLQVQPGFTQDGRRILMAFPMTPELPQLISNFRTAQAPIDAYQYAETIKSLKAVAFGGRHVTSSQA
jgi:hypothetical protein